MVPKFYDRNGRLIEPGMKLRVKDRGQAHSAFTPLEFIGTVKRLDFSSSQPGAVLVLAQDVKDFDQQRNHAVLRPAGSERLVSLPGEYNEAREYICYKRWQHPNWYVHKDVYEFFAEIIG